jgi:hypothetical protein
MKYDALLVATALRYQANAVLSIDGGFHKLAASVGMRCARPVEYEDQASKQLVLITGGEATKSGE